MSVKKIKQKNGQQFLDDIKKVSECLVIPNNSFVYLPVTKRRLLKEAESERIHYYISDKIYSVRRLVMIVI
jgi:hypothetical protein